VGFGVIIRLIGIMARDRHEGLSANQGLCSVTRR
jgi:hypothetical protein